MPLRIRLTSTEIQNFIEGLTTEPNRTSEQPGINRAKTLVLLKWNSPIGLFDFRVCPVRLALVDRLTANPKGLAVNPSRD